MKFTSIIAFFVTATNAFSLEEYNVNQRSSMIDLIDAFQSPESKVVMNSI